MNNTNSCPTENGISCYNPISGLFTTYDNVNTSPINSNKNGSYCESNDGLKCNVNYGKNCNLTNGYLCATSD